MSGLKAMTMHQYNSPLKERPDFSFYFFSPSFATVFTYSCHAAFIINDRRYYTDQLKDNFIQISIKTQRYANIWEKRYNLLTIWCWLEKSLDYEI